MDAGVCLQHRCSGRISDEYLQQNFDKLVVVSCSDMQAGTLTGGRPRVTASMEVKGQQLYSPSFFFCFECERSAGLERRTQPIVEAD